jgi:hypothetical protein
MTGATAAISMALIPGLRRLLLHGAAKRGLESSVSTKVSRIWNLMMSFFVSCQLTMDRDDATIV